MATNGTAEIATGGVSAPEADGLPAGMDMEVGDAPGDELDSLGSELDILFGSGSGPTGDDSADADADAGNEEVGQDDSSEGEEEEADIDEKDEETPEAVQQRFDDLHRELAERDEKIAGVEAKLSELEQHNAGLQRRLEQSWQSGNPFAGLSSEEQIAEKRDELKGLRSRLRGNLAEGMTIKNGAGEDVDLEPADVKRALDKVEKQLEEDLPSREFFLKSRKGFDAQAAQSWPDMFKKDTDLGKFAEEAWQSAPYLQEAPNAHVLLGILWEGAQAIKARAKAKPAETPKVPEFKRKPVAKKTVAKAAVAAGGKAGGGKSLAESIEGDFDAFFK